MEAVTIRHPVELVSVAKGARVMNAACRVSVEAADHARLVGPDWARARIDRGSVPRAQRADLNASAVLAPALQAGPAAVGRCLERALQVAALTATLRPRRQLARGFVAAGGSVVTRLAHLHHAIAARRADLVRVMLGLGAGIRVGLGSCRVRVRVRLENIVLTLQMLLPSHSPSPPAVSAPHTVPAGKSLLAKHWSSDVKQRAWLGLG